MKTIQLLSILAVMASPAIAAPLSGYQSIFTTAIGPSEASAITYNRDTDTLFTIGDEGHELRQISKTGQLIDKMDFNNRGPAGSRALEDPEGLAYLGGGQFAIADERAMTAWVTSYNPGTEVQPHTMSGYVFGENSGNSGLEGVAFDPINNSLFGVKEVSPLAIYEMSNLSGSGTVSEPFATRFFNRTGIIDIADIFMLSNSNAFALDDPRRLNMLILSQESNVILEMTRAGAVVDTLDISFLGSHSIEGITMDDSGTIYLVSETTLAGGGSTLFVLNAVPEPSTYALFGLGLLGAWAFSHRRRTIAV